MQKPVVITDDDLAPFVRESSTINSVVTEVEEFMRDKKRGQVVTPPRFTCEAREGRLVMTSGASERKKLIGLRVYSTFEGDNRDNEVTADFDMDGGLKGIFVGSVVGMLRTAAINAVAIKHLSRHDSETLGIIGTGKQAKSVAPVISQVRDFKNVIVNSQNSVHAERFIRDMKDEFSSLGVDAVAEDDRRRLVEKSDVVVAATTATRPVIASGWLSPGQHVTSMGEKFRESHEIDPSIVRNSDIAVTDSAQQLKSYGSLFFVDDAVRSRISDLSDYIDGEGRNDEDISVFLSVGLAGTEVVVADRLLSIFSKESDMGMRKESLSRLRS